SVGCLKNWGNSVFVPPIPDPLRSALQNMELGNSNKIFCGWPQKWWGNRPLSINILWNEFDLPKDKEWLYGIVEIFSTKEDSMLRAFVSGEYSLLMEKKDESEVKNDFTFFLKKLMKKFYDVPEPNFFKRYFFKCSFLIGNEL
ncbi:Glutathione S-transferase 1, partial [Armadillidium vulgare]